MEAGVRYGKKGKVVMRRFLYIGAAALKVGYPLCFDQDYGTAAIADEGRACVVELPTTLNNMHFAGVVLHPIAAATAGDERWVDVALPGSTCLVWSNKNCTINATVITAEAGQVYFGAAGFRGRGTAIARQTKDRTTPGTVLATLDDGEESGLSEVLTATAGGATTVMVGGTTHYAAATPATDATSTLGNGTFVGQRKAFVLDGTQTTNDIVITVTTPMPAGDTGYTAPAAVFDTYTMDAATEFLMAHWNGQGWECRGRVGTTA